MAIVKSKAHRSTMLLRAHPPLLQTFLLCSLRAERIVEDELLLPLAITRDQHGEG